MHSRSGDNLTAHPEAAGIIRQASGFPRFDEFPGPRLALPRKASAASSLHPIQAGREVPGHRSRVASREAEGAVKPHAAMQAARLPSDGRVAQGISARGSHGTVRNSLPLHGSYHPGYTGNTVQAQWAKNRGYCLVILCHAALALRYLLSRLYFLRIQRIR
jgi:hypothetical protein